MSARDWVLLIVVVVLVVAVGLLIARLAARQRRTQALRDRFGSEYDSALKATGSRRAAEARLAELADRRDRLTVTPLTFDQRARYETRWEQVQARFVDEPGQAVQDADGLVTEVMAARGYPTDDFDERAALLATDHGDVVRDYRLAHSAFDRHRQSGQGDTEDLRQAFVHYRSLFQTLTRPDDGAADDDASRHGRHVDLTSGVDEPVQNDR